MRGCRVSLPVVLLHAVRSAWGVGGGNPLSDLQAVQILQNQLITETILLLHHTHTETTELVQ